MIGQQAYAQRLYFFSSTSFFLKTNRIIFWNINNNSNSHNVKIIFWVTCWCTWRLLPLLGSRDWQIFDNIFPLSSAVVPLTIKRGRYHTITSSRYAPERIRVSPTNNDSSANPQTNTTIDHNKLGSQIMNNDNVPLVWLNNSFNSSDSNDECREKIIYSSVLATNRNFQARNNFY